MGNLIYNSPYNHQSDAGFRAWGKELSDAFQACGLAKAGDTGQINWATATRPGTNSFAGYEMYYLNDSAHSTAPLYIKFEYGTQSNATRGAIAISVGTGSDGAGNLISEFFRTSGGGTNTGHNQTDPHPTYVCAADGAFWFAFKVGSMGTSVNHFFFLARTVGSDGEPSGEGFTVVANFTGTNVSRAASPPFAVYRYDSATPLLFESSTNRYTLSLVWGSVSSSLVVSSPQVYKHYTLTPRVRPNPYILTVLPAEIGVNAQFEARVVAGKSRNYISLPLEAMACPTHNYGASYAPAPVWE